MADCKEFVIDVAAATFGTCKCGARKEEHTEEAQTPPKGGRRISTFAEKFGNATPPVDDRPHRKSTVELDMEKLKNQKGRIDDLKGAALSPGQEPRTSKQGSQIQKDLEEMRARKSSGKSVTAMMQEVLVGANDEG